MTTTITTTRRALLAFLAMSILFAAFPSAAEAQVSGGAYRQDVRCAQYSGRGAIDTNFLTPFAKPGAYMAASILRWDPANPGAGWQNFDAVADISGFQPFKYTYFDGSKWWVAPGSGDPMWQAYPVFSMLLGQRKANTMQGSSGFVLPTGSYYAIRVFLMNPGSGWVEYTGSLVHKGASSGATGSADGKYCYIG